ncbi:MAG: hypothetical protein ACI9CV_001713, partial [Ilumatobacter sp.]
RLLTIVHDPGIGCVKTGSRARISTRPALTGTSERTGIKWVIGRSISLEANWIGALLRDQSGVPARFRVGAWRTQQIPRIRRLARSLTRHDKPWSGGRTVPPCAKACKLNLPFGSRRGRASLGRDSSQAGQSGISSLFGLADLAFSCCISCRVGGVVCQSGGRAYALAGCALRNLSTLHSSPPKYGATCPRFPVSGNLQRCMPSHQPSARHAEPDLQRHTI